MRGAWIEIPLSSQAGSTRRVACVHWVLHRKVFLFEKLFNADASSISCEVVGGAASAVTRSATELMEKQANQLTPRIQMPAEPFKLKAQEYTAYYMRRTANAKHPCDVMEQVITALETAFGVSRQAAKIRMVEVWGLRRRSGHTHIWTAIM